jgi:hypothetical protein
MKRFTTAWTTFAVLLVGCSTSQDVFYGSADAPSGIRGAPPVAPSTFTSLTDRYRSQNTAYYTEGSVNMEELRSKIEGFLQTHAIPIAFTGAAGGELLVHSERIATAPDCYYQVRVIAEHYDKQRHYFSGALKISSVRVRVLQGRTANEYDTITRALQTLITRMVKVVTVE